MNYFNLREKRINLIKQLKDTGYTYQDVVFIFGSGSKKDIDEIFGVKEE